MKDSSLLDKYQILHIKERDDKGTYYVAENKFTGFVVIIMVLDQLQLKDAVTYFIENKNKKNVIDGGVSESDQFYLIIRNEKDMYQKTRTMCERRILQRTICDQNLYIETCYAINNYIEIIPRNVSKKGLCFYQQANADYKFFREREKIKIFKGNDNDSLLAKGNIKWISHVTNGSLIGVQIIGNYKIWAEFIDNCKYV